MPIRLAAEQVLDEPARPAERLGTAARPSAGRPAGDLRPVPSVSWSDGARLRAWHVASTAFLTRWP